ncbi:hypothetical protein GO594_29630 [Pseudomonas otitidis]|uniref:Uncharacterized protein n=1 Tax=Metapseudomonas otitidis TaxID=319939 RepID=A0A7X3KY40_9GAMM|nr:hypothetical protein [Pseudomonas otitidis]MWK60157.1 hypothetical protein [Pseudomonas otitidis]
MDAIVSNLGDPAWWFTGIFFATLGVLLARLFSHIPNILKSLLKSVIVRRKYRIKNSRFNQSLVNYQIARTNSYFMIFIIICCLYAAWLVSGSFLNIVKASPWLAVVLSSPIYISEIIWLIQDTYTKDLARSRGKIT